MNELIASGEPLEEILVINIIHRDMKMVIAAYGWRVVLEFPVDSGNDMRDVAILQCLCTFEADEPEARN